MTNFIRDNSKKLLAVFGVMLMIVFILPAGLKNGNTGDRANRLVGYAGDQKIFSDDLSRAAIQWQTLETSIVVSSRNSTLGSGDFVPWVSLLSQNIPGQGPAVFWFPKLAAEIRQHPEIYYLLQKEADELGISVNNAEVDAVFSSGQLAVKLPQSNGAVVPLEDVTDPDFAAQVRDAMAALLKVNVAMTRAEGAIKVSEPRRRNVLATTAQNLMLNVVEFSADDYLSKVAAPTDDDLHTHFGKFAEFLPGDQSSGNPHGFGYRYPDRVTLQYIAVPSDAAKKAIRDSKDEYTWTKDAYKIYFARPAEFQTDPVREPATTRAATTTTSNALASSQPTTKPFESVRDQIVDQLIEPELEKKLRDVQDRVNGRLANDFALFQKLHPMSASATMPTTAPGELYSTYEYLSQVAADVKKETGVLPTVGQVGTYSSAKDLGEVPGIGKSALRNASTTSNTATFATYAISASSALSPTANASNSLVLQLFQPSPVLEDTARSTYVFRLTGVKASGPPASMDEVKDAVVRDAKLTRAYDTASADAMKLVAAANTVFSAAMPASAPSTAPDTAPINTAAFKFAATTMNKKLVTTSTFGLQASEPIDPLKLDDIGAATFRGESLKLLQTAATQPTSTVVQLDLPLQQRVYAAQLAAIETSWPAGQMAHYELARAQLVTQTVDRDLRLRWLDFDAVAKRINWKDDRKPNTPSGT